MTLTEEQREAIRAVSDLPRAIGCTQCHSYIQEHYGNQFAILRAMIDSGEHFTDASKMPGFDLERARGLRDFLQDDCAEVGDVWAEMIAEIERLRAENAWLKSYREFQSEEQAARISDLEIEITGLKADLEQSEEIKRLKDELENYGDHYACLLISKDAQIKELEGMLSIRTEELDIAHSVARSEKEMHEKELAAFARRIKELEDAHKRSGKKYAKIINELRSSVYANIPGLDVGKIGPDAKPRSWQITEERVGLLRYCLDTLLDAPDIEESPGPRHSIEMLRAMLTEAE